MKIKASYHQERLWFIDKFEAGNLYKSAPVYHNIPLILYLQGPIDIEILERSIHKVIHRHEALRTKIITIHNEPVQCIKDKVEFKLTIFDLPGTGKEHEDIGRYEQALHLAVEDSKKPFLLDKEMLIRGTLIPIQEKKCLLVLTLHHLISDRYSLGIITREIFIYYQAFLHGTQPYLPDLPLHYADFSQWQREFPGDFLESLLAYWKRKLSGKLQALQLPTDYPRPALHTFQEGRFFFSLEKTLYDKIESTAQREKTTHFIVLLAAFKILLHRYSHLDEIIVGTSALNRHQPETRGIVGPLANLLVLRDNINGSSNFSEIAADLTKTVTQAYKHMDLPFDRLVTELKPDIDMSRTALFDVLFQYDKTPFPVTRVDNLEVSMIETNLGWGKYDLNMLIQKGKDAFSGILVYNKEYYKHPGISRLIDHYKVLLESIFLHPGDMAAKLLLLTEKEKQQLLVEWNRTAANYPKDKTLHCLFEEQVERTPDNIALVGPLEKEYRTYRTYRTYISYQELNDKSDQLAYYLIEKGVTTDTIVGIMVQRSAAMIIAILGILKAGGAYLPIDPGYPEERINYMLKDSSAKILLTGQEIAGFSSPQALYLSEGRSFTNDQCPMTNDQLAYIIYTSGTSGYPKGCLLSQRNVIRLFINDKHPFTFDEHDVWIMAHSYCFDFSVWEMYGALLFGGKLIVPGWASVQDTGSFLSIIKKHQVTILNQTPGAFYNLIEEEKKSPGKTLDKHLRCVCFGGDKLEPAYLKEWVDIYPLEKLRLINMYGITETTVHVTYHQLKTTEIRSPGLNSPIGRPLPETTLYIYDNNLNILPIGVPGELYVGGSGVARGYLNKPELTKEKFVRAVISHSSLVNGSSSQLSTNDQCPMTNDRSSRLYQTGDLGRWVDNRNVEYLGRIDDQVKIRGYRIEPGEIAAHLLTNKKISKAIVLAVEDMDKNKRLAAYFVAEEEITNNELRGYLKKFLPDHMIPGFFIQLDRLPLTTSGKIDKQALPGPGVASTSAAVYQTPRNKTEALLVDIWQEILGIEKIGINHDFFSLGGDSLNGIRVVNEIQERLGEIVHIAALFQYPTIKEFSEKLESYREEDSGSKINEAKVTELRKLIPPLPPLSFPGPKNNPAIFVLSPYRSGSTLLRIILGGHSQIFAPPELELLSFNTLSERKSALAGIYLFEGTIRAIMAAKPCDAEEAQVIMETCEKQGFTSYQFYYMMQQWLGNKILADKTPSYSFDLDILKRAELYFQSPQYIHLVRNPYAVIHSFKQAKIDQVIRFKHSFTVQELAELLWVISNQNILEFLKEIPPQRKHLLKFEELVKEPGAVTAGICRFLGLPYEEKMLDVYEKSPTRMTDGIYPESRMIGDVKFLQHSTINEKVADDWQKDHKKDFLGDITRQLASTWGYFPETITSRFIFKTREVKSLPLEPVEKKEYYPVSSAQKRLFILHCLEPDNTVYNTPQVIQLGKDANKKRLAETFRKLIARHESLRTSFITIDDEPVQRIYDEVEFDIENEEVKEVKVKVKDGDTEGTRGLAPLPGESHLSSSDVIRHLSSGFTRPFNLAKAPLLRIKWIKSAEDKHLLFLDLHHIVTDGTSHTILIKEFMSYYAGRGLTPLKLQYKDFSGWQNSKRQREMLKPQEAYWLKVFSGEIPVLELPIDNPRPLIQSFAGCSVHFIFDEKETQKLKRISRETGTTLYMVILSVYTILLAKLSGQEDIIVGTPVEGRQHADLEGIVGMFVNTLALRNSPIGEKTFADFLGEVKECTLAAFENQEYQFEDLVEKVSVQRDASRNPVFDVVLNLLNQNQYEGNIPADSEGENYDHQKGISKFDMSWTVIDFAGKLLISIEYSSRLFKPATIERFIRYFKKILAVLSSDKEIRLSGIEIISRQEKQQLLEIFNDTQAQYPKNKTICQLFEKQARKIPDNIAVVGVHQSYRLHERSYSEGTGELAPLPVLMSITYKEVNRKSDQLAGSLVGKGVQSDTIVAIMSERSIEMVVAILGILKAGGAYLPIDPAYPEKRIDYMIKDSSARVLVTTPKLQVKVKTEVEENFRKMQQLPLQLINLETKLESVFEPSPSTLTSTSTCQVSPANLAYIIYTSGSTGKPKGTMVEHRSLVNLCCWHNRFYKVTEADHATQYASFGFDASVWEIFPYLIKGATLHIIDNEVKFEIEKLHDYYEKNKITIGFLPTQLCQRFMDEVSQCVSLRVLLTGGDKLNRFIKRDYRLYNNYGPTENTVVTTAFPVENSSDNISIGKPIDNNRVYILNKNNLQLQPLGVVGELCIGGDSISRGYLNRPQLTAEKFCLRRPGGTLFEGTDKDYLQSRNHASMPIPHYPIYRTGDLARRLPNGNIEYLGRVDHQVKIRGYRIELGEIENQLLNHEAVKEAVVTARGEENQDKYLCAYIIARRKAQGAEFRAFLEKDLPDYMIPSYFVFLERIPLTPNGKIDRKRLPAPELKGIEEYTAPRTAEEKKLAEIWAEVLGIGKNLIGIDHNFFEIGGHSLKATILISRIHKKLDTKLSLDRIFKFPTIRGLSACLATAARERFSPIKAMEKKEFYELTFNQKRLWYIQQKTPETTSYHMGEVIFLNHRVDIEALQSALKKLFARHESLRTGFEEVKGKPVQFVLEMEDSDLPFRVRDVSALEEEERKRQTAQIITEVTDPPFDLRKPSLFRAALIKQHTENYLLVYNMHHIISDGWSMEILKKDFNRYYRDYTNGKETLWEPLLLQYKDFAHWHNEQIQDPGHKDQVYKFWKKKVETGFPLLKLTHHYHFHYIRDNQHNANPGGGWYRCAADQILKERLHRLAKKNQTSLFMVLFSIYNLLMAFLSGQDEVVSVVISAGRQHDSLHPIVGYFINPIIIKTHIILQEDFENLLSRINREVLEVLQYQEYPLELVLDDMKKEFPQVGISFNMLNMQDISTETELDSLTSHHNKIHKDMKFDIALSVLEYKNGIDFNWGYRNTIFNPKTMENFAQKYLELMEDLTLDDESKS